MFLCKGRHHNFTMLFQPNCFRKGGGVTAHLGEGQWIFWYAGPADSDLLGPTQLKNGFTILFFSYPPISLELLIPQKWFTYQCLQNQTRNMIILLWKFSVQTIFFARKSKTNDIKNLFFFYFF